MVLGRGQHRTWIDEVSVSAELPVAVVLWDLWDLNFIDGARRDGLRAAVAIQAHGRVGVALQDFRQSLGLVGNLLDLELVVSLQLLEYRSLNQLGNH